MTRLIFLLLPFIACGQTAVKYNGVPVAAKKSINPDTVIHVFLVKGQSNSYGYQSPITSAAAKYKVVSSAQKIWDSTAFVNLNLNTNNNQQPAGEKDGNVAHSAIFAYEYAAACKSPVYIVQFSKDGAYMYSHASFSNFNVNAVGAKALYTRGKTWDQRAIAALPANAKVEALIWYQGESDAQNQTYVSAYKANTIAFFDSVRSYTGKPNLPIYMMQLHKDLTLVSFPLRDSIIRIQKEIAARDPFIKLITVDDLPLYGDNVHLTTAAQTALGLRIIAYLKKYY